MKFQFHTRNRRYRLILYMVSAAVALWPVCFADRASAQPDSDSAQAGLRGPITAEDKSNSIDEAFNQPSNPEQITIPTPSLTALITIDREIDPFRLDASSAQQMSLRDVSMTALSSNLDIGISDYTQRTRKAELYSSLGNFLPDITTSYLYTYLKGKANVPFGSTPDALSFNNPLIITSAGFKYYGYRGGKILFGTLQSRNNYRAAKHAKHATVCDTLNTAARLYYELVLQEALLQIRIRAVRTSEEELQLSKNQRAAGTATKLDVLQAETQLSQDRQRLIDQQVDRRDAAIRLAEFLNVSQDIDIVPTTRTIVKTRLLSPNFKVGQLLSVAIDARPELKQYEELRKAAKKQIVIASADLQPSFQFNGTVFGIGETLGNSYDTVITTRSGLPASPAISPAVSGGLVARRVNRQITGLFSLGYQANWNLRGLGTIDSANIYAAKLQARQAALEQTKVLNQVTSEVRRSYLETLRTDRKIEEAVSQVTSATEELKLARVRYQAGLGKHIDVLRAQQDYTEALIEKAQAIVNFNIAEVQLLRDTGAISLASLNSSKPLESITR